MSTALLFALACADSTAPELSEAPLGSAASHAMFQAEILDYSLDDDGPLVAQLIEEVPGRPTEGAPTLQVAASEGGYVEVELPTPVDPEIDNVRYRLVLREALPDGTAGAIRGIWVPRLTWHAEADATGAPAGWSAERQGGGVPRWEPLGPTELRLQLRPVVELTVGGSFEVPDVVTGMGSTVRVALLDRGEVVPGAVGVVLDGTWAIRLDGPLDTPGTQLRPVAYIDADGVLGYDPAAEARVGLACADDAEAFVQWVDEPWTVPAADLLRKHGVDAGWNTWAEGGREGVPAGDVELHIAASCD